MPSGITPEIWRGSSGLPTGASWCSTPRRRSPPEPSATRMRTSGPTTSSSTTRPMLVDPARFAAFPDGAMAAGFRAGKRGHDLLFVSRVAPNKRIEDLLKVFAVYRRAWDRDARLFVVGRPDTAAYVEALQRFAGRLGVEEVHFAGRVSDAELAAYYAGADAFV